MASRSWLMSAMDTELPGEAAGISEVEDISEIISEPTEEVLEEKIAVEDKDKSVRRAAKERLITGGLSQ